MDVDVCNVDGGRGYRVSHSLWLVVVVVGKESEKRIFFNNTGTWGLYKNINAPFRLGHHRMD